MTKDKLRLARNEPDGDENERRLIAAYEARLLEVAELAARVRHEINNPLTGLLGQSQLLLRENLSDSARRRVETIEHLAGRIRDTVALLRDVEPHAQSSNPPTARADEEKNTRQRR
ncbi:MAG TPA: histidine kinase dimerization/phospho-acceptor domain-containing protein [Pyrinomonadaceae bacterium]|jgi:signal transduction histidine kinase